MSNQVAVSIKNRDECEDEDFTIFYVNTNLGEASESKKRIVVALASQEEGSKVQQEQYHEMELLRRREVKAEKASHSNEKEHTNENRLLYKQKYSFVVPSWSEKR